MSIQRFLTDLQETGRVRVGRVETDPACIDAATADALRAMDRAARSQMAFDAPPLSLEAAAWGAVQLYRGCQCYVFRDLGQKAVRTAFSLPPPPTNSETAYSVDLALRYLPDLIALASGLAREDPLVDELRKLAKTWPLSSVGVGDLGELDVEPVVAHRSIMALYVDRVIERRDRSRLAHPAIREAVRAAIGLHEQACPEMAAAVGNNEEQAT